MCFGLAVELEVKTRQVRIGNYVNYLCVSSEKKAGRRTRIVRL